MRLCVLTATRGESAHLAATVRSVAGLGLPAQHILVCPAAKCDRLALAFPSCRVVAETDPGLYAALNTGFAAANREDFFTWLNDDDTLVLPGFRAALDKLAADPAAGVVYGRVGLVDGADRRLGEIPVAHRPGDLPALLSSGLMPLAQPGTIFRWSVADQIGMFDASYRLAGDLEYFTRAVRAGVRFDFHDGEVASFRLHAGQLSKDQATAAVEHARAIEAMPRIPAGAARRRFRWDNRRVYWARLRQHGFKRMDTLYRHG